MVGDDLHGEVMFCLVFSLRLRGGCFVLCDGIGNV